MGPESSPGGNEPKPRSILFDWDNTLVDSWPIIHDALNVTLATFGLEPWSLDETRTRVRKSLRDRFPGLFGDKWQAARDVFYDRYAAIHIEKLNPLSGADEMLEALHGKGIHLAVLSNKKGDY